MSLPAEVLPQLLHGSALSGQPEGQRGLWLLREGTGGYSPGAAKLCVCVFVKPVARTPCTLTTRQAKYERGHTVTLLHKQQTTSPVSQRPAIERNVTICPLCNLRCHHAYVFVRSFIVFRSQISFLFTRFSPPIPLPIIPLF